MYIDDLNPAMQRIISTATEIPLERVILADQGRAPPGGLDVYATYLIVPVKAVGGVRRERKESDGPIEDVNPEIEPWTDWEEAVISSVQINLSCNFFNRGANDAALSLMNADRRSDVYALLNQYGIGWRDVSEARKLTNIMNAGVQQRYQADVSMWIDVSTTYGVLRAHGWQIRVLDEDNRQLAEAENGLLS
ncbi:phage neck terminator protein [Carnimonas bestiolae]|uniref:phage neck terminator protein n=1 Tax=Carnimonas bestiolae TaxID=3402172 RepID=UPI003EDB8F99